MIGMKELLIILVVVLLVFGTKNCVIWVGISAAA